MVDAHLDHNLKEEQFLKEVFQDKAFEKNSELLSIYLKQRGIAKRTANLMSIKVNKLVNNIDKDETDYLLKLSKKAKKEVLKEIMILNERLQNSNSRKSLIHNLDTHEAVKKILAEEETDELKKRQTYNLAEINYRASFLSKKMTREQSLELFKGWMKQKKHNERANQFDNLARKN